jgi:hypothetical protein
MKARFGRPLAALLGLFAGVLLGWQTRVSANWETEDSLGYWAVGVEHNRPELITKEINNLDLRCVIAGVTNPIALPLGLLEARLTIKAQIYDSDSTTNTTLAGNNSWMSTNRYGSVLRTCRLEWSSAEARKAVPQAIQKKLLVYIEQRLRGHTKEYLIASLREKSFRPSRLDPHVAWIRNKFPDVPVSWIKKSSLHTYEKQTIGCYQVVDGPLAWIYYTDTQQGTAILLYVVDAQEVNERTRDAVRQSGEEAHRILADRGVKRTIGYVHSFWPEKKRILREMYGIYWQSPGDLNSGIFD